MKVFFPDDTPSGDLHQIMLGSVVPRPIALVSTISENNISNLAPFSYFNAISSLPPVLAFSISKKSDGNFKDTYKNLLSTGECVINMVNYEISHQMALAGIGFDSGIDEFIKCGFSKTESKLVKPYGVENAPVRFECQLDRFIEVGNKISPSYLAICNVVCIHIDERVLHENKNRINSQKLDLVGRLGRTNYLKFDAKNVFSIEFSRDNIPIGHENLPKHILESKILTANQISCLAACTKIPTQEQIEEFLSEFSKKTFEKEVLHSMVSMEVNENNFEMAMLWAFIPDSYIV